MLRGDRMQHVLGGESDLPMSKRAEPMMVSQERRRERRYAQKLGFDDRAWEVLISLYDVKGPVSVTHIAKACEIPQTTILRRLASLDKCNLIELFDHPNDKRVKLIQISNFGSDVVDNYFDNKRLNQRKRVFFKASLISIHGEFEAVVRDVSTHGARIARHGDGPAYERDDLVAVRIGQLFTVGRIAWLRNGEIGVSFYQPV